MRDGDHEPVGRARHQHVDAEQLGPRAPRPKACLGCAVGLRGVIRPRVQVYVAEWRLQEVEAAECRAALHEKQSRLAARRAPAAAVHGRERSRYVGRVHEDVDIVRDAALEVLHVERGERHALEDEQLYAGLAQGLESRRGIVESEARSRPEQPHDAIEARTLGHFEARLGKAAGNPHQKPLLGKVTAIDVRRRQPLDECLGSPRLVGVARRHDKKLTAAVRPGP